MLLLNLPLVRKVFILSLYIVQGVLFHDRMKTKELQSIKQDLAKLEKAYREAHPGTPIQAVAS